MTIFDGRKSSMFDYSSLIIDIIAGEQIILYGRDSETCHIDGHVAYRFDLVSMLFRKNLRREFDVRYLIISVSIETATCIFYLDEIAENNT